MHVPEICILIEGHYLLDVAEHLTLDTGSCISINAEQRGLELAPKAGKVTTDPFT